ncbi:hypothetical protein F4859DRAFT_236992 [Xylaria cf. heliscus]|nr:hypothetical protein F4859DRAFT_236992 [Xylaria cf. heliscus]
MWATPGNYTWCRKASRLGVAISAARHSSKNRSPHQATRPLLIYMGIPVPTTIRIYLLCQPQVYFLKRDEDKRSCREPMLCMRLISIFKGNFQERARVLTAFIYIACASTFLAPLATFHFFMQES